jgi:hypothetical protein
MNSKKEDSISKIKEKYPISVNAQQCIGPCYYSNTRIIHPLTLDEIAEVDHNFCPVNTFIYTDPKSGKSKLSNIDLCYVPTSRETRMDDLLRENVIAPQFIFSSEYFVKIYYRINNLEDLLKWLDENRMAPYRTKERVFNNSMVAYGEHLNIVDQRLVQFVNDIMLENLPKIYRHIKKYIAIENDKIKLVDPETINEIRNYIKEKFLGSDNIHQFMSKFIRYYKEDISDRHISYLLVDHMIDYITKRIKLTLEQTQE